MILEGVPRSSSPLLCVAVFSGPLRELAGNLFNDRGGRALQDGLEGCIELVLELFGNAFTSPGSPPAFRVVLKRALSLIGGPGDLPNRLKQIAAPLPPFAGHGRVNFFHLGEGHAETQRVGDFAPSLDGWHAPSVSRAKKG